MLPTTKTDHMKVFSTRNYSNFKSLQGNRNINQIHLKRLKESIEKNPLISPIIVNEIFEIIDGQHRFCARQELGLPIQYIIVDGYGLKEVQILNTNTKNWTPDDYMNGYIELGYEDYMLYKKFKEQFGFGHMENMTILTNNSNYYGGKSSSLFRSGEFKIKDYKTALKTAEKLMMVKEFYDGFRRRSFVNAMVLCFNNPKYNHGAFIGKLQFQSTRLIDCADTQQYLTLIEEIYNFKSRIKINLRFKND